MVRDPKKEAKERSFFLIFNFSLSYSTLTYLKSPIRYLYYLEEVSKASLGDNLQHSFILITRDRHTRLLLSAGNLAGNDSPSECRAALHRGAGAASPDFSREALDDAAASAFALLDPSGRGALTRVALLARDAAPERAADSRFCTQNRSMGWCDGKALHMADDV